MNKKILFSGFGVLGGVLILFICLPILAALINLDIPLFSITVADPEVRQSVMLTLTASAAATVIGLVLGVPLAYVLSRSRFPGKYLVEGLVDLPVVIPHTAAGIALLMVFGRQGMLGAGFASLGYFFTDRPAGVVVAMLFVSIPFLVNLSKEAFNLIDPEMERVAWIDGASAWQSFWYVILPQAWRGVAAGGIMMWARGLSEFGAVVILAYHPKVIPVLIFERFEGFGLSAALPVAVILILAALAAFGLLRWLMAPAGQE